MAAGYGRFAIHTLRVLLFCGIVLVIHLQHRQRVAAERARAAAFDVPIDEVRAIWPTAERLADVDPENGTRDVLVGDGTRLGFVLQTSPRGDAAIGFSGPTNLLLGFAIDGETRADRIVGVTVLSSGDTREHVQQITQDSRFLAAFVGRTWDEATRGEGVDAVSGATLTSLAMREAIALRLGDGPPKRGSLKFPEPPTVAKVEPLFAAATRLEPDEDDPAVWHVRDEAGASLGMVLRTVPAAEDEIGYQGPTETLVGLDPAGRVVGFAFGRSFDNEPYVGYVRDEPWYLGVFEGRSLAEVAEIDLAAEGVEGVSGATMTSMAVARSIPKAAAARLRTLATPVGEAPPPEEWSPSVRDVGTTLVVLCGLVIGLTSLRGRTWVRVPFQLVVIGYLGFVNGDLVSQALLVGWSRHGVPVSSAAGLAVLTFAALAVPIFSKTNLYCSHLCPHGAIQQLLRNRLPLRLRLSRAWTRLLSLVPALLLAWVVVVALGAVTASLVDIEPFDAYVPRIAGAAALAIFVAGLVASLFVPMAYCRFGCPTGALLGYLRFNARSGRLSIRDAFAVGCLALGATLLALG